MKTKTLQQVLMMSKYLFFGLFLQSILAGVLIASPGKAQSEKKLEEIKLSFQVESQSLKKVFKLIERKTDFTFTYNDHLVDEKLEVSLNADDEDMYKVLSDIASQTGVQFKRINSNIFVSAKERRAETKVLDVTAPDQVQISGKVTSVENDEPLPGVSILVKGTSSGTVTNIEGEYKLSAPVGSILQFSYIGFVTQEVTVGSGTTINVSLELDMAQLEEVLVVGYGTQKKKDVTGSIASVDMETIKDAPMMNAVQALQGRTAGVSVIQNTGKPGAGFLVQVRGVGTVGNTQPLFVIDGIVGAGGANSINPNDIESIEVLKDASASAIYGSRAANGVVLITTKRGKAGKPTVSLNSYYGVQNVWKTLDVLNAQQYAEYANELQVNGGQPPIPNLQNPSALQDVTDWQDELFQSAPIQDHNVTFSGGSEKARYMFSAGYYGQEGIVRNSGFDRFSFRANSDFNIGEKIEIGESFLISSTNTYGVNEAGFSERSLTNAILMPTYIPVYDPDAIGGFAGTDVADGSDPVNPIKNTDLYDREEIRLNILGNAYLNYEIIEGLTYKFNFAVDYNSGRSLFFRPTQLGKEIFGHFLNLLRIMQLEIPSCMKTLLTIERLLTNIHLVYWPDILVSGLKVETLV